MTTLETIIIAIVEGLTEFLPVSSTGHMIITQNLLGVESTPFVCCLWTEIDFVSAFCERTHLCSEHNHTITGFLQNYTRYATGALGIKT